MRQDPFRHVPRYMRVKRRRQTMFEAFEELRASLDNLRRVVKREIRANVWKLVAGAVLCIVLGLALFWSFAAEPVEGGERHVTRIDSTMVSGRMAYFTVTDTIRFDDPEETEIRNLRRRAERLDGRAVDCFTYRGGTLSLVANEYRAIAAGAQCVIAASTLRREARDREQALAAREGRTQ